MDNQAETAASLGPAPEYESSIVSQYLAYPFDSDDSFQRGLVDILSQSSIDATGLDKVPPDILRRIRVFYFNRVTGNTLTEDEVKAHEEKYLNSLATSSTECSPSSLDIVPEAAPSTLANAESQQANPPVLSFAQIKALIESGNVDQIPNNKAIPGELNDAPPSQSILSVRKKPWEVQEGDPAS